MFHPGWQLLSPSYWQELVSSFPLCGEHQQLMCPSSVIGSFEFAILGGALTLLFAASGVKRRYGLVIVGLLALIHFYALLSTDLIFGRLHLVNTAYLMWALFPLAPPAVVAGASFLAKRIVGRRAVAAWMPA